MTARPEVRFLDRTTPPHIVTLVLMAGVGAMNMSAFLPSLPAMAAHFGTDYAVMQLSVSLYLAVTAAIQLVIGPISDRFGRRPVVLASTAIFTLATLACIVAPSAETFLLFRMISATAAVGFVLSRAIVRDMVPQAEAASMIGYVTMGMSLVPMVAPMIGGGLEGAFGWQATFVFLALSGMGSGRSLWADQGETFAGHSSSFAQQVREYPELLTSRRFWGYVFAAAFAAGAFFAFLGGAPYVASEVYGLSPFWAGVAFGAPAIGYAFGNFLSGRFSVRVGINRMILYGSLVTAPGSACRSSSPRRAWARPSSSSASAPSWASATGSPCRTPPAGLLSVRPQPRGLGLGARQRDHDRRRRGAVGLRRDRAQDGHDEPAAPAPDVHLLGLALVAILYVMKREREVGAAI
jgi:MFS transporter, DHA1 family, multidrug resistance protein